MKAILLNVGMEATLLTERTELMDDMEFTVVDAAKDFLRSLKAML